MATMGTLLKKKSNARFVFYCVAIAQKDKGGYEE